MNARWKPNVTVAAVVERDGRFLFVEEQKREGLLINQPAGHLEPGESILDAVRREVLEETAYAFAPQHLLGIYRPGPGDIAYLRFAFTGTLGEFDASRTLDDGIVGTVWLTPDEVRASARAIARRFSSAAWTITCGGPFRPRPTSDPSGERRRARQHMSKNA